MEQTLPPLVSDERIGQRTTKYRAALSPRAFGSGHMDDLARTYTLAQISLRDIYEKDRAKTREVVQALVDALRNADRYGNFRNDGPYHFNPDSDQHALQKFEAAAIALAKSQLQIEPTKP